MKKNVILIVIAMMFSLSSFGQACDKYIDKQTNNVKTKGVVLKILGKTADAILGTNFSSLTQATDQLKILDNVQYQACLKLQEVQNEFTQENLKAKVEQTVAEMAKLLNQSGALPPEVVEQLVDNGIIAPGQSKTVTQTTAPPSGIINADDVPVPILPVPAPAGSWNTVTFPCQTFATTSAGVIRARGMETSMDPQIAKSVANVIALEELASKIEVTVKSTTQYFIDQTKTNLSEELNSRFTRTIDLSVNQTIRGYRNVCEEYQENSATQKFRCYVAIEIDEDAVLKPVHDELAKETGLKDAVPNYKKFKETFNQVMNFYEKTGMN